MTINTHSTLWALTASIVDSDPVISTFAACEWDELGDDGRAWLCAIVGEAMRRAGVSFVPVLPVRLVDRPRRSEDPRLARAHDDSLLPPAGETIRSGRDGARGAASGNQPVLETAPHTNSNDGGAL